MEAAHVTELLRPFDAETARLRYSRTLCGDTPAEVADVVGAREEMRRAIVRRIELEAAAAVPIRCGVT